MTNTSLYSKLWARYLAGDDGALFALNVVADTILGA